jgi:hypothetical protein
MVPSNKVSIRYPVTKNGIWNVMATTGATMTSGKPLVSQCDKVLPSASADSGTGLTSIWSRLPSSKSDTNRLLSDNNMASSAATHITAGPLNCSCSGLGPTASGNSAATIAKKNSGLRISPGRFQASNKSRRAMPTMPDIMPTS